MSPRVDAISAPAGVDTLTQELNVARQTTADELRTSHAIQFQESLGVSANVLDDRLSRLVDQGILEQALYSDRPPRF